jgi:hypothetical protein
MESFKSLVPFVHPQQQQQPILPHSSSKLSQLQSPANSLRGLSEWRAATSAATGGTMSHDRVFENVDQKELDGKAFQLKGPLAIQKNPTTRRHRQQHHSTTLAQEDYHYFFGLFFESYFYSN